MQKRPRVITSFSWSGYQKYGKKFVETWIEHWPKSIGLTVYYEGKEFEGFDFPAGISWVPIEMVEFLGDFLDNLRFPIQQGIVGHQYDINFDARMGRKAFMQVYAARKYGGKVFWIDADTITTKSVPETFLDNCLPDDKFCCFLGRDGWYFTESGFLGFNSEHPVAKEFFRNYVHLFITGVIFTQAPTYNEKGQLISGGWHDCVAFDSVRHLAGMNGFGDAFLNLAADVPAGTMHPFQQSAPGEYMKHLKGVKRKEIGDLLPGDVVDA